MELSDWSGSGWGSGFWLGGLGRGRAGGLGLRRGEREWLRFLSRFAGERDFLLESKKDLRKGLRASRD